MSNEALVTIEHLGKSWVERVAHAQVAQVEHAQHAQRSREHAQRSSLIPNASSTVLSDRTALSECSMKH